MLILKFGCILLFLSLVECGTEGKRRKKSGEYFVPVVSITVGVAVAAAVVKLWTLTFQQRTTTTYEKRNVVVSGYTLVQAGL